MKKRILPVPVVLILLLSSCMQLGINTRYATPRRESRIPRFTEKDSLKGFNNRFRSAFDVKHYRISLRFDPKKKSIGGSVTTRFLLLNNSDEIQLDLDKKLRIDSITGNSGKLSFRRVHSAVLVSLASFEKEQQVTVYYRGKPRVAARPPWEGGFVWKKDKNKRPFAGVACEGEGAGLWLPVKSYLGDEPDSVTCLFTCPSTLSVVSNGRLLATGNAAGQATYHWQTGYPINPYNITFYLGDYTGFSEDFYSVSGDTVALSYFVLPENEAKARIHFEQVKKVLKTYEHLFGPYPWPRDGFRLVESPYAGMEHQTAIAYGNGYKNDMFGTADYIIVHEAAHEWWGNAVSVSDFSDIWIHEGFATYAEALFMEQTQDPDAYLFYMRYVMMQVMNKKPVVGPAGVYYWDYRDGDVYMKGAAVLHTLRNEIADDSLFFALIRTFFNRYRYAVASTKDFIALAEDMAGRDLGAFFTQYLYRRESPVLEWERTEQNGKSGIAYRLARSAPGLTLKIKILNGGQERTITAGTEIQFTPLGSGPLRVNTGLSYVEVRQNGN